MITLLEFTAVILLIYGFSKERKVIAFETRLFNRFKVNAKRAVHITAVRLVNLIERYEAWHQAQDITNPDMTMPVRVRNDWRG